MYAKICQFFFESEKPMSLLNATSCEVKSSDIFK